MNCCEKKYAPGTKAEGAIDRRTALMTLAAAVGAATLGSRAGAQALRPLKLAFCGQLLCVVPYEVTRERGHFAAEGLDVTLVYTRGGNAAMQALVGGAVDYAGTSFDVAVQAFANGAKIRRFVSTGRLPLFALAVAPKNKDAVKALKDLENRTVGVSALGNADHTLLLFMLAKAGAKTDGIRFATIGTNLYDALRLGQVDAGMVQEPALSLIVKAGGTSLVNLMDLEDAHRVVGGAYEFMGVAVRAEERDRRLDEMRGLSRALARGIQDTFALPVEQIAGALPKELLAGGDRDLLLQILDRYRKSLYPETVRIDTQATGRVVDSLKTAGVLKPDFDLAGLLDREVVGS